MSVYTHLNQEEIEQILSAYDLGCLISFKGIENGVENTNYFIDIDKSGTIKRYVLTLFEYLPTQALPFFINYTGELKANGLPVPSPIQDQKGNALQLVKDKPALIVPCFAGDHPNHHQLSLDQCQQVGDILARIHISGINSSLHQENQRGLSWLNTQKTRLIPLLNDTDSLLLEQQWDELSTTLQTCKALPKGLIHGDLFHNNVLFGDDGKISAVIDFYQACSDWLIYDLAVTVNDWCLKNGVELDNTKLKVLLAAYTNIRELTDDEKITWPLMLRFAALRFWISRLITFTHPKVMTDNVHQKNLVRHFLDPDEFKEMLVLRTNTPAETL
ncbi:MAG: homoserine kinase [Endozoicomonas sp.]